MSEKDEEIARLREEIARLRAALQQYQCDCLRDDCAPRVKCGHAAREALRNG